MRLVATCANFNPKLSRISIEIDPPSEIFAKIGGPLATPPPPEVDFQPSGIMPDRGMMKPTCRGTYFSGCSNFAGVPKPAPRDKTTPSATRTKIIKTPALTSPTTIGFSFEVPAVGLDFCGAMKAPPPDFTSAFAEGFFFAPDRRASG